jgi:hypothetical protein
MWMGQVRKVREEKYLHLTAEQQQQAQAQAAAAASGVKTDMLDGLDPLPTSASLGGGTTPAAAMLMGYAGATPF